MAVQGFGNAGSNYAIILEEMGAKLVAASDSQGGIYSKKGFDSKKVLGFKEKTGTVVGFPGTEKVTNDELLADRVRRALPGGPRELDNEGHRQGSESQDNRTSARTAPRRLRRTRCSNRNKVLVVPDILANSGGVIVSYLEWVQNLHRFYWSEAEVNAKLEAKITSAFNGTHAEARSEKSR